MKDQSYQSGTTRVGSCIKFNSGDETKMFYIYLVTVRVFPAWYHCGGGLSMSRQVKMTRYPPLILRFFVAIFWCQDELARSSSWPQCPGSGLKQGEHYWVWQSSPPVLSSSTNLVPSAQSCRRVGKAPEFILWKSTRCSRLGNLVLAPSREKAFLPVWDTWEENENM